MKRPAFPILVLILLSCMELNAQLPYRRSAFTFDVTRLMINEVNMGFEQFISQRKSIEFEGGIVYANEFLQDAAESYTVDPIFYEHGFAIRFHYKFWHTKEDSKWRNFLAPGFNFKHVYYNDYFVSLEKTDESMHPAKTYTESFYQDRERDKFGIDFIWGNVYEASRTIAFEIYYGAGLTVSSVRRTDHDHNIKYHDPALDNKNKTMPNSVDHSVYLRPIPLIGFKLVFRL
jgi:hypothetical protein